MPVKIVPVKNATSGYRPVPSELVTGELATNTADGALYMKDAAGNIIRLNPSAQTLQQIAGRAFAMSRLFGR